MIHRYGEAGNGSRPTFETAEAWLNSYYAAVLHGRRPWPPATRAELIVADDAGILAIRPEWLPGQQGLALLELPDDFGRTTEPLSDAWAEGFLMLLHEDAEFCAAAAVLLARGAAACL